jgi:hypothetical protein
MRINEEQTKKGKRIDLLLLFSDYTNQEQTKTNLFIVIIFG